MKLNNRIKSIIKKHALDESPNECCGVIYSSGRKNEVLKCRNLSDNPTEHFYISNFEKNKAMKLGTPLAVYHSHTNDVLQFSDEDKAISEYFKITYVLYCTKNNSFYQYDPIGADLPYLYRPYITKILGHIQLIGDYYQKELNIILDTENKNNIEMFLEQSNFQKVGSLKTHDILLVKWSDNKLYGFIYLGNNRVLAQTHRKLPDIKFYNYGMKQNTIGVYRHANG